MLAPLINLIFGKPGAALTQADREVSEAICRLKTLSCVGGCVSVSPSEVLTPDYIQQRREATRFLSAQLHG